MREEEERRQAQLRLGIPIRMDTAHGTLSSPDSSPEVHSPSQVLLSGVIHSGASPVQNIDEQVMSPKGRKAENFTICSQPPTPRHHDEDEDDWTTSQRYAAIVKTSCSQMMCGVVAGAPTKFIMNVGIFATMR
eukprot:1278223-Amphidinium_carterae.1